jgi:hypothetical protein
MRSFLFAVALIGAFAALPALAQAPAPAAPPVNVRGKIIKLDGHTLVVKTREGPTVDVALAPDASVRAFAHKKLSDIHSGDYIASASTMGKDGKLHALEIHFLAPSTPEGQRPWDLKKDSVMTNAHVSGIAKVTGGTDLAVTYKGSSTDVIVDSKTVIVGPADATMADLKPGKAVMLFASKGADGAMTARLVFVEKNGVKPPL